MQDYVWDGRRDLFALTVKRRGAREEQVVVPRRLRKVQCGVSKEAKENAKHERGEESVQCMVNWWRRGHERQARMPRQADAAFPHWQEKVEGAKKKSGMGVATMRLGHENEYKNCMMTIAVDVLAGLD